MTDRNAPSVRMCALAHQSGAPARAMEHESGASACATAPASSARAEASRRNGAKSRGPKTEEGKARSALNALKHGLRSHKLVLLADEEIAAFRALEGALRAELAPEGALQELLATRVAVAAWRMLRADRMELELLDPHVGLDARGQLGGLGLALIRDGHGPRAFDTLLRYRSAVQAEFWRSLCALSALKGEEPVAIELAARATPAGGEQWRGPAARKPPEDCRSPHQPEPIWNPNEPERPWKRHEPAARCAANEPEACSEDAAGPAASSARAPARALRRG